MTSSLLALVVVSHVFLLVVSHDYGGCEFNGTMYPYGVKLTDLCAPMICDIQIGPFGLFGAWNWTGAINSDCKKCTAYMDPHVITFDSNMNKPGDKSYAYNQCGNYTMTQPLLPKTVPPGGMEWGATYTPDYAVFSTFDEYCGYGVSCVSSAIFKEDDIIIVAKSTQPSITVNVWVNDDLYIVPDLSLPKFVPPGPGLPVNTRVMAWRDNTFANRFQWTGPATSECVFFQGTKGLLVQFCGNEWANSLYIWAMPDLTNKVNGLCGTINDKIEDDFTTRFGVTYVHVPTNLNPWAETWLTVYRGRTDCHLRRRRSIQDKKTTCIDKATHQTNCNDTIVSLASGLSPYELKTLTDDCTFDLCHVDNSTGYLHGAVAATVNIATYINSITITEEVATTLKPTTTDSPGDRIVVQIQQKVN